MYIPEQYAEEYLAAIRASDRPYNEVYGTIVFTDNTTMAVDTSVLLENSISISRQCIDGEEIMFGGVFLGTLKLSLFTDKDRYAFYGAEITLNFRIEVGVENNEPIYAVVPLGVYIVADAETLPGVCRVESEDVPAEIVNLKVVNLVAYDRMMLLDIDLGSNVIQGEAWDVLSRVSEETGLELAFDSTYLEAFPNVDWHAQVQFDKEHGCNTYRDVTKAICQMLGCFAQASRDGKLELRAFASAPVTTLTTSHWYSITPADYICRYYYLQVTGLKGTIDAYAYEGSDDLEIIAERKQQDYIELTVHLEEANAELSDLNGEKEAWQRDLLELEERKRELEREGKSTKAIKREIAEVKEQIKAVEKDIADTTVDIEATEAAIDAILHPVTPAPFPNALKMIIADAPAWDYGNLERLFKLTYILASWLYEIGAYTPVEIDMPGDPAFDCGDRLSLITSSEDEISTLITSYEWKWHQGMTIVSEGINPNLTSADTSYTGGGSRLINQEIAGNKIQFYSFTNPSDVEITDTDEHGREIGQLKFAASSDTNAEFIATIPIVVNIEDGEEDTSEYSTEVTVPVKVYDYQGQEVTMYDADNNPLTFGGLATVTHTHTYSRDGHVTIEIWYKLNGVNYGYGNQTGKDRYIAGDHLVSVCYPISSLSPNIEYTFSVHMKVSSGTVLVPRATMRATIFGQGITTNTGWDGNVTISDTFTNPSIGSLKAIAVEDSEPVITLLTPIGDSIDDEYEINPIDGLSTVELTEDVSIVLRKTVYGLISEDGQYNLVGEEQIDGNYLYNITTEAD